MHIRVYKCVQKYMLIYTNMNGEVADKSRILKILGELCATLSASLSLRPIR